MHPRHPGTRAHRVGMCGDGMTTDEILAEFPQLTVDDIHEAPRYAAAAVDERVVRLAPAE